MKIDVKFILRIAFIVAALTAPATLFAQTDEDFETQNDAIGASQTGENALVRRDDRVVLAAGLPSVADSTTSLTIPGVVGEIGKGAFEEFVKLETLYLEDGVKKIGAAAFVKSENLKDVYLFGSVKSIAEDAFPKNVTIHGPFGSYAEKWANKYKINFQRTSEADLTKAFPDPEDPKPGALLYSKDKSGAEILCAPAVKKLSGEVVIPKRLAGSPVVKIGDAVFADAAKIETVALPDGLKALGARAFAGCRNLASVVLPPGLEKIGSRAFYQCYSLKSLEIPSKVETIEDETFQGCVNLASISLPERLLTVGVRAFYDCAALPTLQLPIRLKKIDDAAFGHCYALNSLRLPNDLETIGSRSFASNICLVVAKGSSAAEQAAKGNYKYATDVLEINDDKNIAAIFWREATLGVEICGVATTKEFNGSLTLPEKIANRAVMSVADGAFTENTDLKEVSLPPTVKTIGAAAFKGCSKLVAVALPQELRAVGKEAFANCQLLKAPTLPDDLEWIGPKAFADCGSIEEIRLPYKLNLIGEEAFWSCDNLTNVVFPYNLKLIGARAFAFCEKLESLEIPGGVMSIGPEAFPATILLKGGAGSVAEKWANENNVKFEAY